MINIAHTRFVWLLMVISIPSLSLGASGSEKSKIVYLCGERHDDPEDIRFQARVIAAAASEQLIFAKEGLNRDAEAERKEKELFGFRSDRNKNFLYGIENPTSLAFSYAVTSSMLLSTLYKHDDHVLNEPIATTNELLGDSGRFGSLMHSLLDKSIQPFLETFWATESYQRNRIFKYLFLNRAELIDRPLESQGHSIERKMKIWRNSEEREFLKIVSSVLAEKLREQLSTEEQLDKLDLLAKCVKNNFERNGPCDLGRSKNSEKLSHFTRLTLTNHFIAKNLEEIYETTAHMNKPLVCIIGTAHLPGLTADLQNKGFTVLSKEDFLVDYGAM